MIAKQEKKGVLASIIELANPVFIVLAVGLPIAALVVAMRADSLRLLAYVHIMAGAMWTGIDLFMGFVLGPVLGGMAPPERVAIFRRLMPKMTFLMPVLATVTSMAGIELTQRLGLWSAGNLLILAALGITLVLTVQGFGFLLPNEIRIFKQLLSDKPDVQKISRLGMQNARLGGIQGVFQLLIILVMASLRFAS